jgi:hypothetical protein
MMTCQLLRYQSATMTCRIKRYDELSYRHYDTNPPTIVLVSVHKQAGDPQ